MLYDKRFFGKLLSTIIKRIFIVMRILIEYKLYKLEFKKGVKSCNA